MTQSIDLTAIPGFKNEGPAAAHHPKPLSFGETIAHVAVGFFIVGLVFGLPVLTALRMAGWR